MKSKSNLKSGIVVLILLLAIGFASVTTTLFINGTINIGVSESNFQDNVIFYSAVASGDRDNRLSEIQDPGASASISDDGKSITFITQRLDVIGEESELTYTIKNNSAYSATLGDMKCNIGEEYNSDSAALSTTSEGGYVSIVSNNELTGAALDSGDTSDEGTVTVTLLKSYVDENTDTITFTCRISATTEAGD